MIAISSISTSTLFIICLPYIPKESMAVTLFVNKSWSMGQNIASLARFLGKAHIDALAQDCGNSIANALVLLQSCTKASIRSLVFLEINSAPNGRQSAAN